MIKVVLKMYLAKIQNEKKPKTHKESKEQKKSEQNSEGNIIGTLLLALIIAMIIISSLLFFVLVIIPNPILFLIAAALLVIVAPILIYFLDRNYIKKGWNEYVDYNNRLNQLRDVLAELKCNDNGANWNSKNKIEYLINECTEMINQRLLPQKQTLEFIKLMILPIISFVAGVISQKTNIEQAIQYAAIALLIVIIIWGIKQIIEFIDEITMKSSSINTIESVRHMLSDLLVRDFELEE